MLPETTATRDIPADVRWTIQTRLCYRCHAARLAVRDGWVWCDGCGQLLGSAQLFEEVRDANA